MIGVERKAILIHTALEAAGLPHAIGGALALAFCTLDPRGTIDIDVNVFVPTERTDDVLDALPDELAADARIRDELVTRAQARLRWDETPVDLFLSDHPFHAEVLTRIRTVPFGGVELPVLGCTDLLVFKTLFGRTKDWADIESMADADAVDFPFVLALLGPLLGTESPEFRRLVAIDEGKRGDVAWEASRPFGHPV